MINILGLDLSLTATGVALPDGATHTIRTRQKDGDHRLAQIETALEVATSGVDYAVIEDLPVNAMSAGITGMVHGIARNILSKHGIPFALISPATLKKFATDYGNADKVQMAAAAYLHAGVEFPGDLTPAGKGGDQCDAWWLRAAGHDRLGVPLFVLPEAQRIRLGKAKWAPFTAPLAVAA